MQKLIDLFSHMFAVARYYPKPVAEAEAAKIYVHAIKDARLALLGFIGLLSSIAAMVVGFFLFALGLVYTVSPPSIATAALILGGLFFILPVIGFAIGLSQKFLLKVTKTEELIKKVKQDSFRARSKSTAH